MVSKDDRSRCHPSPYGLNMKSSSTGSAAPQAEHVPGVARCCCPRNRSHTPSRPSGTRATGGSTLACFATVPKDLVWTLGGPPAAAAIAEIGLPWHGHVFSDSSCFETSRQTERVFAIVDRRVAHNPPGFDARKESPADTRLQRGPVEGMRTISRRDLVERKGARRGAGPIGFELAVRPSLHQLVLELGERDEF